MWLIEVRWDELRLGPQSEGMAAGISAISLSVEPRANKIVRHITDVK
jgi:hypothetical protein